MFSYKIKFPIGSSHFQSSVVLICALVLAKGVWSACPGNPNRSVKFESVPEENYDRNYSSITSIGKRPLGFDYAIWKYNQDVTPCINITGGNSKRLEIMFETFPQSRLCVVVQADQKFCSDPGTGKLYQCIPTPADTIYLEFTCDSQCSENDVQFWVRLVPGDTAEKDPEDHWCDDRDREGYPESLRQLAPDYPMNSQTMKPNNLSHRASPGVLVLMFAATFVCSFLSQFIRS